MAEDLIERGPWNARPVRVGGELVLEVVGGADANHDPRSFRLPLTVPQLEVLRADLGRHVLLGALMMPLCDAAGTEGPIDQGAALSLLPPILDGDAPTVDAACRGLRAVEDVLIAHGADPALVEDGRLFAASRDVVDAPRGELVRAHRLAQRDAARGILPGSLDEAVLEYTGLHEHRATIPRRRPEAVAPALMPEVLRVVAVAERAATGSRIRRDPRKGRRGTDRDSWRHLDHLVSEAVRRETPGLTKDAVAAIGQLICSEAWDRARDIPLEEDADFADDAATGAWARPLSYSDDKGDEQTWAPDSAVPAAAAFWGFVADRVGSSNEVFTLEDEEAVDGIQLHFYADSAARVRRAGSVPASGSAVGEPSYLVEYTLIDGFAGYRELVASYLRGGYAALDGGWDWTADIEEFERTRRARETAGRV